jgi:hypothetical protein
MEAGRSVAILPEVRAALDAIVAVHSTLPPPTRAGHFSLPNPE